jgi:hypothetical protein
MLLCPRVCITWRTSFVLRYSLMAFQCLKVWAVIIHTKFFTANSAMVCCPTQEMNFRFNAVLADPLIARRTPSFLVKVRKYFSSMSFASSGSAHTLKCSVYFANVTRSVLFYFRFLSAFRAQVCGITACVHAFDTISHFIIIIDRVTGTLSTAFFPARGTCISFLVFNIASAVRTFCIDTVSEFPTPSTNIFIIRIQLSAYAYPSRRCSRCMMSTFLAGIPIPRIYMTARASPLIKFTLLPSFSRAFMKGTHGNRIASNFP